MEKSRQLQLAELVARVQQCRACPRMESRRRVLGPANGSIESPIVFIAEAPGRLGADRYGIPLYGDQTGRNFEALLASAGLRREVVFITNAVLCNPRTPDGRNDRPTVQEVRSCSKYLAEVLQVIRPQYVAPLGSAALTALAAIEPHDISLARDVGRLVMWRGHSVFPLYHPGPRALIRRMRPQQIADYCRLGDVLRRGTNNDGC